MAATLKYLTSRSFPASSLFLQQKQRSKYLPSLQAGSHLGAHARAAKSEFESEAILREESGDEARRKWASLSRNFWILPLARVLLNVSLLVGYNFSLFANICHPEIEKCVISEVIQVSPLTDELGYWGHLRLLYKHKFFQVSFYFSLEGSIYLPS